MEVEKQFPLFPETISSILWSPVAIVTDDPEIASTGGLQLVPEGISYQVFDF